MKYQIIASIAAGLYLVSASPAADALPWAQANPQANAAANAYADAYAEAIAIAHPDPEAYALAASADDCASIACHASCGSLIIEGQACSQNSEDSYSGPYNSSCLCSSDSKFMQYYSPCLECGWTLWKYYSAYVTSALEACSTLSTEPTGTARCSTTLTDSYTPDFDIDGCSYLGNCEESTTAPEASSTAETSSQQTTSTSQAPTSTAAEESTSSTAAAETSTSEASTSETETTAPQESTSSTTGGETQAQSSAEHSATEQSSFEQSSSTAEESTIKQSNTEQASSAISEETTSFAADTSSSDASVVESFSSSVGTSSSPTLATFEGAAVKVGASSAIAAILFSLLF